MKNFTLLIHHVSHHPGGRNEMLVGPYPSRDAAQKARFAHGDAEQAHKARGAALGERWGPKLCVTQTPPYEWDKKTWGDRPSIEVCSPTCEQCRSGEHNEVRDAS